MKRKVMALSTILLGVLLLTVCTASQAEAGWKLAKELNPEGKKQWVMILDREIAKFSRPYLKKYNISRQGFGFSLIDRAESSFVKSGSPLVTAFSPDQISLKRINPKYHYLFVIPIPQLKKILAKGESVIASRLERITTTREVLSKEGWVFNSETKEVTSITLIAAPNKGSLKKAITRFFKLEEIPLEPVIFAAR